MENTRGKRLKVKKSKTVTAPSTPFDTLPDECIYKIFSYLDAVDRVRIERVCKKWQYFSKTSWREITQLYISSSKDILVSLNKTLQYTRIDIKTAHPGVIRALLSRCGQFITHLFIEDDFSLFNCYTTGIIGEYCSNIYSIQIDGSTLSYREVAPLLLYKKKLKSFTIFEGENCLDRLFFLLEPESIEDLSVVHFDQPKTRYLFALLNKATSLRSIKINFSSTKLFEILGHRQTLVSCDILAAHIGDIATKNALISCISQLINLEFFRSSGPELDDACLIALATNCRKLKTLAIYGSFTEVGFAALSSFDELTTLDIGAVDGVFANCLRHIPSTVADLNLTGCEDVTDDGIIPLIYRLKDLVKLHAHCPITTRTLEEAVIATRARTNGKQLIMNVDSGLEPAKFNGKSPRLKVM